MGKRLESRTRIAIMGYTASTSSARKGIDLGKFSKRNNLMVHNLRRQDTWELEDDSSYPSDFEESTGENSLQTPTRHRADTWELEDDLCVEWYELMKEARSR